MVKWLQEEEFLHSFNENYHPKGLYLINSLGSEISFSELCKVIPVSLSSNLDEEDGLGVRDRWFGAVDDLLFTITCLPNDYTTLSLRERDETTEKYQWSFLEKLIDFPHQIFKRIVWIRNPFWRNRDLNIEAESSIFFKSEHGIVFEAYRAASEIEAQELLKFLDELNSEYEYWIGEPEPGNQTWIIISKSSGEEDKIVGRYPQRSVTEDSARFMSTRGDTFYQVKEENTGQSGLTFFKGEISQ